MRVNHPKSSAALALAAMALSLLALAGCPKQQPGPEVAPGAGANAARPADRAANPAASSTAAPPPATNAPQLATITFAVTGMDCEDCSAAIEKKLIGIPGVATVSADYKAGSAKAQYDPAKVGEKELAAAIESLGYTAKVKPAADTGKAG